MKPKMPSRGGLEGANRKAYFDDLEEFIVSRDYQTYTVLCINREVTIEEARRILKTFAIKVDQYCLGRRCIEWPKKRYRFIATPEHMSSNFHWNILGKLPRQLRSVEVESAQKILTKLLVSFLKSGSLSHANIYDLRSVVRYSLKEKWMSGWEEEYVLYNEFHPP